jgi:hypothetical protein
MDDNNQANNAPDDVQDNTLETPQEDPLRGVKSEFNRKLDDIRAQQEATMRSLEASIQQIASNLVPRQPSAPTKPLKELIYDDTDAFAEQIATMAAQKAEQIAAQRATQTVNEHTTKATAFNQVVNRLASEYPELNTSREALQVVEEMTKSLPKSLQGTPEGAELAIMRAAGQLGLTPASKRKSVSKEDFSMPGSSSGNGASQSRARKQDPSEGIDQKTLMVAQLMGRDITDPKVLEGLREASKRKNWKALS